MVQVDSSMFPLPNPTTGPAADAGPPLHSDAPLTRRSSRHTTSERTSTSQPSGATQPQPYYLVPISSLTGNGESGHPTASTYLDRPPSYHPMPVFPEATSRMGPDFNRNSAANIHQGDLLLPDLNARRTPSPIRKDDDDFGDGDSDMYVDDLEWDPEIDAPRRVGSSGNRRAAQLGGGGGGSSSASGQLGGRPGPVGNPPSYADTAARRNPDAGGTTRGGAIMPTRPSYGGRSAWKDVSPGGFTSRQQRNGGWESSQNHRAPILCTVCGVAERYSKNGRSYETCGLTCAARLAERKQEEKKPCCVCNKRPRAVRRNGEVQQTCGYTCSDKLKASSTPNAGSDVYRDFDSGTRPTSAGGSARGAALSGGTTPLCEHCQLKPRAVSRAGTMYAHCGTACRDKSLTVGKAIRGACSTCIVCWRRDVDLKVIPEPWCNTGCGKAAYAKAPTLIEVPRGHAFYYTISDKFEKSWDTNERSRPSISHIYVIVPNQPIHDRYDRFKAHLKNQSSSSSWPTRSRNPPPTESSRWLACPSECNLGSSGVIKMCNSPGCVLCNIILNGPVPHGGCTGTPVFSGSSRADAAFPANYRSSRASVLLDVVSEKEVDMTIEQLMAPLAPQAQGHGHSFIRVVTYGNYGGTQDTGQLCVFVQEAMVPRYLVVYS